MPEHTAEELFLFYLELQNEIHNLTPEAYAAVFAGDHARFLKVFDKHQELVTKMDVIREQLTGEKPPE